jgi:hypothetical protein
VATTPRLVPEVVKRYRAALPFVRHLDAVLAGR